MRETQRDKRGRFKRDRRKCPNQTKGEPCYVCGGAYVCLDPWRTKGKRK